MLVRDRYGNIVEVPNQNGGYYKAAPQTQQPNSTMQLIKPLGSALLGAGLKGVSGSAPTATAGTTGTTAAGATAAEAGSLTGGVGLGGLAAGGYTGYQQLTGAKNALKGEDMTLPQKAALALPTFGGSLIWDKVKNGLGVFGGKSQDQQARDKVRESLQQSGFFGQSKDDWTLDNPDGSGFDVGKDGGARLDDGRRYYDVNVDKQGQAIGAVNPLAYLVTGGDEKLATNFAGYFTNTITQGAGATDPTIANANALDKYKKAGFDTPDKAHAGIDELVKTGKLDPEKAAAFHNGINTVFGTVPKAAGLVRQSQASAPAQRSGAGKKRRGGGQTYTQQTYTPQTYAPTTTAPMGTTSPYGDSFAQSLANVYLANQGL